MQPQQVESVSGQLESAGVDWLTATAYRTHNHKHFQELGNHLLLQSASYGNDVSNWKGNGYHGQRSGGVALGVRYDTHIIRLSSDDAREHWREVAKLATNVSRLDLQITFRLTQPDVAFIRDQHARATAAKFGRGRRSSVTLIQSSTEGDSLYLGRRSSDVYARCYDKGKEQKTERAGVLIRQELEYKSDRAAGLASHLTAIESDALEATAIVSSYMQSRGIQTMRSGAAFAGCARGRTTQNGARRAWLERAVRPSCLRLIEAGMLQEVIDALGLSPYVQPAGHRADDNEEE